MGMFLSYFRRSMYYTFGYDVAIRDFDFLTQRKTLVGQRVILTNERFIFLFSLLNSTIPNLIPNGS